MRPLAGVECDSRLRKIQVGAPAPDDAVPRLIFLPYLSAATQTLLDVCIDLRQTLEGRKCLIHHLLASYTWYYFGREA